MDSVEFLEHSQKLSYAIFLERTAKRFLEKNLGKFS